MFKKLVVAAGLVAFIASAAPVHAGGNPVQKCRSSKSKCMCKKLCSKMKAVTKNEAKPDPIKLADNLQKAESKFSSCIGKAVSKGGCPPGASLNTLESKVDAFMVCAFAESRSP